MLCDNLENTANLNSSLQRGAGDIQYFWKWGRTLHGRDWAFYGGDFITHRNHVMLSYPYKFMSSYLDFRNNLKKT